MRILDGHDLGGLSIAVRSLVEKSLRYETWEGLGEISVADKL